MWAQEASPNQVPYIHKNDLGKGQEYTKEPVKRLKNSVVCSPSFTPTPIAKIAPKEYRRVDGARCYDEPGKLPLTAVVLRDAVYKQSGVFAYVRSSPATTSPVRPQQSPQKSPYKVSPQTSKQASLDERHSHKGCAPDEAAGDRHEQPERKETPHPWSPVRLRNERPVQGFSELILLRPMPDCIYTRKW